MNYEDSASHKLFWAIVIGLIGVTLMMLASGCASTYTMKNCKAKDKPYWDCEKP